MKRARIQQETPGTPSSHALESEHELQDVVGAAIPLAVGVGIAAVGVGALAWGAAELHREWQNNPRGTLENYIHRKFSY